MKLHRFMVILLPLLMIAAASGTARGAERDALNYRLKWLFNISVAGDLYADAYGAFAGRGLKVNVRAGGPERDAIKELELGHAQFGVASADQVIRAVSKGSPVVVLAQIFQINPMQWIFRPDKVKIEKIGDLRGKTIGVTFGGNDETIMRALLARAGISETEVKLFSVRYDYTPFYEGRVDLWPIYRNAQAIIIGGRLEAAGEKIDFFDPDAHGVRFVANSIVTTAKMMKEAPERVQKFRSALLEGWREAMDSRNAEKTAALVHTYDRDTPIDTIGRQLEITRSLVIPSKPENVGRIDVESWKETERIMLEQKLIPGQVCIEKNLLPF